MGDLIGANSKEDHRFKSISEFKFCMNCGGEVQFEWKGKVYGIWSKLRRTPDAPFQMLISQVLTDDMEQTEMWCDTADKVLEYIIDGDQLRDIITKVEVIERTI